MSQVQFYNAVVLFGGNQFPILPGARITVPKNYAVPPIIGNRWQLNFQEGFRQPYVDCSFLIFDSASQSVLTTAFLSNFLTRTGDYADDTTSLGTITFFDGYTRINMLNAKADSFTIGSSKGDDLRFQARFCGSALDITTTPFSKPSFTAWSRTPLLRFQSVNFISPYTNKVWTFNLSYSNNHTPNMALNNSSFPIECNAGMLSTAFTCTVQANDSFVDNGIDWGIPYGNNEVAFQGGVGSFSSPQAIQFTVSGNNITRTFTLNNPLDTTPDERNVSMPRVMRVHSYIGLGLDGQSVGPLTIS